MLFVKKNEYQSRGITLKNNRNARRTISTLHGKITYYRNILIPADAVSREKLLEAEHVKSIAPLDQILGIAGLPFKMSVNLMLQCAYWAQSQGSYQDAEEALHKACGISINDDTIRLVTNCIGKAVYEEDCRKVDSIFKAYGSGALTYGKSRKGVFYIEADGAALNTRHKDDNGSTWRENKLGVVFSSDNIHYWKDKKGERRHQILKREYVSYIGSADVFKKHLYACAYRNGYGSCKETVLLSDGAVWIANMAEELFPDAQRILDIFHLKENVYTYAKCKFGLDERKYMPWADAVCQKLEDGEWEKALSSISPEEKYPNCVNLYHYIYENRNSINYPEYKAKNYFIGSGAVESGNKIVLQDRLKQAGMRWEPETAQYVLSLKAKSKSGLWEKEVVKLIQDYYNKTI